MTGAPLRQNPWRPPVPIRLELAALQSRWLDRPGSLSWTDYDRMHELERRYPRGPAPPDVAFATVAEIAPESP